MKKIIVVALIYLIVEICYAETAVPTVQLYCHYHTSITVTPTAIVLGSEALPIDTNTNFIAGSSITIINTSPEFAASIMNVKISTFTYGVNPLQWSWGTFKGDIDIEKAVILCVFKPTPPVLTDYADSSEDVISGIKSWNSPIGTFEPASGGYEYPGKLISINIGGEGASPGYKRALWILIQPPKGSRLVSGKNLGVRITGYVPSQ